MEKIIGIIILFAAGYLMFRLQAGAGGCCGTGDHDEGEGQCGCAHVPHSESPGKHRLSKGECGRTGTVGTDSERK